MLCLWCIFVCFSVLTQVCFTAGGVRGQLVKGDFLLLYGSQIFKLIFSDLPTGQTSFHSLSHLAGLSPLIFFKNWTYWVVHFQTLFVCFDCFCCSAFFLPSMFFLVSLLSKLLNFFYKSQIALLYICHLWVLFQIKARL